MIHDKPEPGVGKPPVSASEPTNKKDRTFIPSTGESNIPRPVFDHFDPTLPGRVEFVEFVKQASNVLTAEEFAAVQEVGKDFYAKVHAEETLSDRPVEAANSDNQPGQSFNPQIEEIIMSDKATADTTTSNTAEAATSDAVKAAQAAAKQTTKALKLDRLLGAAMGTAAVAAATTYGVMSANAAAAAAAATVAAGAATTAGEAGMGAAAFAEGGFMASSAAFISSPVSLLGATLPLWGWVAAAAATTAVAYGGYKLYKNRQAKNSEAPKVEDVKAPAAGPTLRQHMAAFGAGFVAGAINTAAWIGCGYLVGSLGVGFIASAEAAFGATYGATIAVGGTFVGIWVIDKALTLALKAAAAATAAGAAKSVNEQIDKAAASYAAM